MKSLTSWKNLHFLKQLQHLCPGSNELYLRPDTSFICHRSSKVSHSHRYVLQRGGCAKSLNRTKWFFNQCNLRPCSAVREQFVKTISRVLNNNDSSLERMLVPQEPCDQWGMDRQRRQKVGHVQYHIHPSRTILIVSVENVRSLRANKLQLNIILDMKLPYIRYLYLVAYKSECALTKVKAMSGCKFNHDVNSTSRTL